MPISLIIFLVSLVVYIILAFLVSRIAKRFNHPSPWMAYVPVLNGVLLLDLAKMSRKWAWIFLTALIGRILPLLAMMFYWRSPMIWNFLLFTTFVIDPATIILVILAFVKVSKRCKESGWFAILTLPLWVNFWALWSLGKKQEELSTEGQQIMDAISTMKQQGKSDAEISALMRQAQIPEEQIQYCLNKKSYTPLKIWKIVLIFFLGCGLTVATYIGTTIFFAHKSGYFTAARSAQIDSLIRNTQQIIYSSQILVIPSDYRFGATSTQEVAQTVLHELDSQGYGLSGQTIFYAFNAPLSGTENADNFVVFSCAKTEDGTTLIAGSGLDASMGTFDSGREEKDQKILSEACQNPEFPLIPKWTVVELSGEANKEFVPPREREVLERKKKASSTDYTNLIEISLSVEKDVYKTGEPVNGSWSVVNNSEKEFLAFLNYGDSDWTDRILVRANETSEENFGSFRITPNKFERTFDGFEMPGEYNYSFYVYDCDEMYDPTECQGAFLSQLRKREAPVVKKQNKVITVESNLPTHTPPTETLNIKEPSSNKTSDQQNPTTRPKPRIPQPSLN